MIKTFATLAVVAAVIAGCGGSSSSSSTTAATSAASSSSSAPTSATTSSAAPTSSSPSGGGSLANNPQIQAAVAACKQRISAAPNLSSDAKGKLTNLCDQAASGNEAAVVKAASQVCQEIVKQSVPSSAQQQALASCPKG
ncbi:MAG: hypothetical protein ACJ76X_15745 [Solirubrobacteraceae bacterium]|jgi:hypothetical protein